MTTLTIPASETTTSTATGPLDRSVRFRSHVELILDRAVAQPDRALISDATRRVTGAEFARGVRNAAQQLISRGITPGSVVALAAPICLEAVLVRYAAGLLGCATVVCPNAGDPQRLRRVRSRRRRRRADLLPGQPGCRPRHPRHLIREPHPGDHQRQTRRRTAPGDGRPRRGRSGRIVVRSTGVASGYAGGRDSSTFRPRGWYDPATAATSTPTATSTCAAGPRTSG